MLQIVFANNTTIENPNVESLTSNSAAIVCGPYSASVIVTVPWGPVIEPF